MDCSLTWIDEIRNNPGTIWKAFIWNSALHSRIPPWNIRFTASGQGQSKCNNTRTERDQALEDFLAQVLDHDDIYDVHRTGSEFLTSLSFGPSSILPSFCISSFVWGNYILQLGIWSVETWTNERIV